MAVKVEYEQVYQNLVKLGSKFDAAVQLLAENGAQKMEAYAKQNRRWRDRTGNARQRLKGSWKRAKGGYKIQIAHGVNYGVWLEFTNERKYAILMPTVGKVGYGEIVPAFNNLLDKIKLD